MNEEEHLEMQGQLDGLKIIVSSLLHALPDQRPFALRSSACPAALPVLPRHLRRDTCSLGCMWHLSFLFSHRPPKTLCWRSMSTELLSP